MSKLKIFISSTCYDLSQIRSDLELGISELGHTPILSESPDFAVNPLNSTIENCIENVNNSADILILLIGNRYGYQLESGKSITNIEFITAKNKGIPIYIFLNKQIINILPIYLKNRNGDYSDLVDNTKILDFADEVRSGQALWTFPFEKYQDIIYVIKLQLSYLFKESLTIKTKLQSHVAYNFDNEISTKALRILLFKNRLFEYEFLSQVMVDEINRLEYLKKDYEYRIVLGSHRLIKKDEEFRDWLSERLAILASYVPNFQNIIVTLLPKYLNEPGYPADLNGLFYCARTYSRVYENFLHWAIDIHSTNVQTHQKDVKDHLVQLLASLLEQVWAFPFQLQEHVAEASQRVISGESRVSLDLTLKLDIDEGAMKRYNHVFENFRQQYSEGS
jgi:uncharacterized membrane-anchored protein YhcB (DUF1043 family)